MLKLTLNEIVEVLEGELVVRGTEEKLTGLDTDTRRIEKGFIYVGIKGERVNGNDLAPKASENGAAVCIVEEINFEIEVLKEYTSIVLVKDTKDALIELSKYYRKKFEKLKIVGVTGSTGKTSTKDLIAAALEGKYKVFKTIGNYNSDIGLPIMIFKIRDEHDVAILEMGMSNFGEIEKLADIARPDMAVITNIGISHIEYLKTRDNILKAKMEITKFFSKDNLLIVNGEDDKLCDINSDKFNVKKISLEHGDYTSKSTVCGENISYDLCVDNNILGNINVSVPGKHNVLNSLLACAVSIELGLNIHEINKGLEGLQCTSMRLDIKEMNGYTLVDDAYNASPDSMKAAIDVCVDLKKDKTILVLGTMRELGEEAYKAHYEIGEYAKKKGVDYLIVMGENTEAYLEGFHNKVDSVRVESYEEAVNAIKNELEKNAVVLVKASRGMMFENIIKELQKINN